MGSSSGYGYHRRDVNGIEAIFLIVFAFIPLFAVGASEFYRSYALNVNCIGHLKRASDANSVELAKQELTTAVKFLEDNKLTSGSTGVIFSYPSYDIGFWYNNLKTSLLDLDTLGSNTSPLEKSNMLIKLRETLLDHGVHGDEITVPKNLHLYPDVGFYYAMYTATVIWMLIVFGYLWSRIL
jgi:hypothetical protein